MSVDAANALLAWYDANRRVLPWRAAPGEATDPYRVWLSEIMLQQTTVAAVRPYFERFTARWPDVRALAAADEAELMAAWAGLGYYARARNLIAAARLVAGELDGQFPQDAAALRSLPGVGDYTAAAIAAIAYGEPILAMDANVERVMARYCAFAEPLPAGRKRLHAAASQLVPPGRPGDFVQALMDLGSAICTPRGPACMACPLAGGCIANAESNPEAYPVKAAKKPRPRRFGETWWLEHDGAVLLVRRPPKGLLGGMLALPSSEWREARPDAVPPAPAAWQGAGMVDHIFTHFALSLDVSCAAVAQRPVDGIWWPIDRLDEAGLPTVFAKAVARALAWREDLWRGAA